MKNVPIDTEELDKLLEGALEELYIARDKTQKAIEKFHAIKSTWITKQQKNSAGLN